MTLRRIRFFAVFLFVIAIVISSESAPKNKAKPKTKSPPVINQDARNLAKAIPKFKPEESRKVAEEHMKRMIHMLASTNRDSVSHLKRHFIPF